MAYRLTVVVICVHYGDSALWTLFFGNKKKEENKIVFSKNRICVVNGKNSRDHKSCRLRV